MTTRIGLVALVLSACTPDDPEPADPPEDVEDSTPDPVTEDTATPTDTGTPTDTDTGDAPAPIVTMTLTPETVAAGEVVELTIAVENFTIVDPTQGAPLADGEGHFHVYVDGVFFVAGWEPSVALQTELVDAGVTYELRVALVDGAHYEIVPTVEDVVTLTVE